MDYLESLLSSLDEEIASVREALDNDPDDLRLFGRIDGLTDARMMAQDKISVANYDAFDVHHRR